MLGRTLAMGKTKLGRRALLAAAAIAIVALENRSILDGIGLAFVAG